MRSATIIDSAESQQTLYFALSVLEDAINLQWKVMPEEEREGIKSFIGDKIFDLLSEKENGGGSDLLINKYDHALVAIIKQDWPHNWPDLIPQLVDSSFSSPLACENNLYILKLLSEDLFESSKMDMNSTRLSEMKQGLCNNFNSIFDLCLSILHPDQASNSDLGNNPNLMASCLSALSAFLVWLPTGYIFERDLLPLLIEELFPNPLFRQGALQCLVEVASISDIDSQYNESFRNSLISFMDILPKVCNLDQGFERGLEGMEFEGEDSPEDFVHTLSVFLATFLKSHLLILESESMEESLIQAFQVLIQVSYLTEGNSEDELFKMMVEFWQALVKTLYLQDKKAMATRTSSSIGSMMVGDRAGSRGETYDVVLSEVRVLMVDRMLKPEEVLVVEDEVTGDIIRERTKDTEAIALYSLMRELMVYLTHLNPGAMENLLLERLYKQVESEFTWDGLNKLCWVVGSINGVRSESDEKVFLVTTIKDLLKLCENKVGKDNKAVIASNIMYVVGQYPRFLRAHWKFLRTVVNKLFEFMHEEHPGVKDMAVDTFLTICTRCRRKFCTRQKDDDPYIYTLSQKIDSIISDLEPHQTKVFFEAIGILLSDKGADVMNREELLQSVLSVPNNVWTQIISEASGSGNDLLLQTDTLTDLSRLVLTMTGVCEHIGDLFAHHLALILSDLLYLHRVLSEYFISPSSNNNNQGLAHIGLVKKVKREVTILLTTFISSLTYEDLSHDDVLETFLPPILEEAGTDLQQSSFDPSKIEVEELVLFKEVISTLSDSLPQESLYEIHNLVFAHVLPHLVEDFGDYYPLREAFYKFLHQEIVSIFPTLYVPLFHNSPTEDFKMVVDSILWGVKHIDEQEVQTFIVFVLFIHFSYSIF